AVLLWTSPPDAKVRVDGRVHDQTRSPFRLENLDPDVPHRIEVYKDGYRGWSTRLSLKPGKVLQLPLVRLIPQSNPAPADPAAGLSEPADSRGDDDSSLR